MAAIGSRFNSLLINAQDPLEKSKKGSKKRTDNKNVKKSPNKGARPGDSPQKTAETAEKVSEQSKSKVVVRDVSGATPSENTKENARSGQKSVKVVVRDVNQKAGGVSPRKVSNIEESTKKDEPEEIEQNAEEFHHDSKSHKHGSFRKMMAVRGKTFDRHSGPRNEKGNEKRHGKGAFNWGEKGDGTNEPRDVDQSGVENPEEKEKEEYVPIVYTLDQYRHMCQEKMLDPLHWQDQTQVETVLDEKDDFRQYEYHRSQGTPRGRGQYRGSRGSSRGRGSGSRPPRGDNTSSSRGKSTQTDVQIDDIRDFPAL